MRTRPRSRGAVRRQTRGERRIPLGVESHEQHGDRPQPDSGAADHVRRQPAGEMRESGRSLHHRMEPATRSVVARPQRSHCLRSVLSSATVRQIAGAGKITWMLRTRRYRSICLPWRSRVTRQRRRAVWRCCMTTIDTTSAVSGEEERPPVRRSRVRCGLRS